MYYVYKFLDKDQKDIYIGMTCDIKKRINQQHFTSNGHLDNACYGETEYVVYSKCRSYDDASIKERYLINKNNPKYNRVHNNKSEFSFIIDDFEWIYIAFDKEKLNKSITKSTEKNPIIYPYDWNDLQVMVCRSSPTNYVHELEIMINEIINFNPNKHELKFIIDSLNNITCSDSLINLLHELSKDKKIKYKPIAKIVMDTEYDAEFYDKYKKNFNLENIYETYSYILNDNKDKIINVSTIMYDSCSIVFNSRDVFRLIEITNKNTPRFVSGYRLNYNDRTSTITICRCEESQHEFDSICELLEIKKEVV